MILSFEITMPNLVAGTVFGRGAKNLHFAFKSVSKQEGEKIMNGKENQNFYYNFGDGWGANIEVKLTDSNTKNKILRKNVGFMGYDWMIDSIFKTGQILNAQQMKEWEEKHLIP